MSGNVVRLANLTPHALTLIDVDGKEHVLPSLGEARATSAAQVSYSALELATGARIAVTGPQRFIGVTVPPFDRAAYDGAIVSMATAQTLERVAAPAVDTAGTPIARRLAVYAPGALVRNAAGQVRGAAALETYERVVL
jgi:hypothetical protein